MVFSLAGFDRSQAPGHVDFCTAWKQGGGHWVLAGKGYSKDHCSCKGKPRKGFPGVKDVLGRGEVEASGRGSLHRRWEIWRVTFCRQAVTSRGGRRSEGGGDEADIKSKQPLPDRYAKRVMSTWLFLARRWGSLEIH